MQNTKQRLEAFTDGVIAIIITIMILSIPLPESFEMSALREFGFSIIIYLLSFLVVGAFWNQHRKTFIFLEKVNQKLVVINIFFLFFLSLIPLFTKWVLENQGELLPVIGYDIIFVITNYFNLYIYRMVLHSSSLESVKEVSERIQRKKITNPYYSWVPFMVLISIVVIVVIISIFLPRLATYLLMGIPIASSVFDLFLSSYERHLE